jgi:hypothetical protein
MRSASPGSNQHDHIRTTPYSTQAVPCAFCGRESKPHLIVGGRRIVFPVWLHQFEVRPEQTRRSYDKNDNGTGHDKQSPFHNLGNSNHPNTLIMLYTIAVVLIVLWLLGLVTGYTMGAFIHVLLVIAVIMVLLNLISGRRV